MDHGNVGVGDVRLNHYPLWRRGKVRDIFDAGDRLVFVATDRVSAFDVVLPNLLPGKGKLLTEISRFWFNATAAVCPNHVISFDLDGLNLDANESASLQGRTMQVQKADRIDVECVVRARLAGSGWAEYVKHGTLVGEPVPAGLSLGDPLPEHRFTPANKNDDGHDENISRATLADTVGIELARELEQVSLSLFGHASNIANRAGFILADSKFEFGRVDGQLTLIDEVLTPDSSRYWDASTIKSGEAPSGFDKQVIRDWLEGTGWNKTPPGPEIPDDIVHTAMTRYAIVRDRLVATQDATSDRGANQS